MSIPDTNNFSLETVAIEVQSTLETLTDCFSLAAAEYPSKFDPAYEGNKDRLSNFRNYGSTGGGTYYFDISANVGGSIADGFSGYYETGAIISIEGYPDSNAYEFSHWSGDTAYINDPNASKSYVTMPSTDVTIFANFVSAPQYTLTLTANTGGSVTQGTSGDYYEDDIINISATADSGYEFSHWSGDVSHIGNANSSSTSIFMPASNISVTANFDSVPTSDWDLNNYTYFFSIPTQDTSPTGIFFKPDGTKMYEVDNKGTIYQSTLSTAWDISTATYDNISKSTVYTYFTTDIYFSSDGIKMYEINLESSKIYQSTLSTPWDISTATYDNVFIYTQGPNPVGLLILDNGTRLYESDNSLDRIYQYTLSTAWDLSTASYDNKSFDTAAEEENPGGIFLNPDGIKLFVAGEVSDAIHQYTLSTAWDISTASYDNTSISTQDSTPKGIFFSPDGSYMYEIGAGSDLIYQYVKN